VGGRSVGDRPPAERLSFEQSPAFAGIQLLDRVQRAREMQIFIGSESEFSSAGDVSVIATPSTI
jgi:transcriptional regulator of heat shock response